MCCLLNGIVMHTAIDWDIITPYKIIDSCSILLPEIQSNFVIAFIILGKLFMKSVMCECCIASRYLYAAYVNSCSLIL